MENRIGGRVFPKSCLVKIWLYKNVENQWFGDSIKTCIKELVNDTDSELYCWVYLALFI